MPGRTALRVAVSVLTLSVFGASALSAGEPARTAVATSTAVAGTTPAVPIATTSPAPTANGPAAAVATMAPAVAPATSPALVRAVDGFSSWVATQRGRITVSIVDVQTGASLASANEHEALNPASNAKVLTAAAVLDRMGPDFRFSTGLYGKVTDGAVSPLVLRGDGDPSLETDELWELAFALKRHGIRAVNGIRVDQSRFDAEFLPPAFGQQPSEWAPFRAPVSAVALERNSVTLNVVPATAGAPALAWFDPPGFAAVTGSVETRKSPGNGVRLGMKLDGARLLGEVSGFIGEGEPPVRFPKRVDDPRLYAGYVLGEILRQMHVDVKGDVALGGERVHSRLAYVESAPLGVLVRELGKNSDNFYAEMLLKSLGAFTRPNSPARSADGADAVLAWMKEVGAYEPATRVVNGSGLFDANRVSAASMTTALRRAYLSPRVGPDFVAQLAVGGVDGTLRSRFKGHAGDRIIRAKTGTLDQVIALSGYVLPPPGKSPVAFSFIVAGVARPYDVRSRIDAIVEGVAADVYRK